MNIFDMLDVIRKNDPDNQLIKVADSTMDLYLAREINSHTLARVYSEIINMIICDSFRASFDAEVPHYRCRLEKAREKQSL